MESPSTVSISAPALPSSDLEPVQRAVDLARSVAQAVLAHDEPLVMELCLQLTAPDFLRPTDPTQLELLRRSLEIGAQAMRDFVLAPTSASGAWKRLFLPDAHGLLECNGLPLLAKKLRSLDSPLLAEAASEVLEPGELSGQSLRNQALQLGRYTLLHDAGAPLDTPGIQPRTIDYAGIRAVLDPRLIAYFDEWLLTCYCQSPLRLIDDATSARQDEALDQLLAKEPSRRATDPAGSSQALAAFHAPYRSDESSRAAAEAISGQRLRGLFQRFAPHPNEVPHERPDAAALEGFEALVVCPNWHEHHVIYRCMGSLTSGLLADGLGASSLRVLLDRQADANPAPSLWREHNVDLSYDHRHALSDLDAVVRGLAECKPDLVFYPEIVPINSSIWMATRRIGRVQATGYGFPCTSGLPTMDYFVGGQAVEGPDAADAYTEDLVLIPGLGATTTEPPLPTVQRRRPLDDQDVRLFTITSRIKLGRDLLRSWDAIQAGQQHTSLTVFSNLPEGEVERWAAPMSELLPSGVTDLRTSVARQAIIDELTDADIYLDAFPFGGFNTLVEVLCAGCPVVTIEGSHARNRFGAAILRRLDLPDFLIARDFAGFVEAARRLSADPGLRAEVRARIGSRERVLACLNDPDQAAHFAAAARYMRERGPRRRGPKRPPVLIEAGSKPRLLAC